MVVFTDEQRDEMMRAVQAIERQLKAVVDASQWQALYVIGSNLTLIQRHLTSPSNSSSN